MALPIAVGSELCSQLQNHMETDERLVEEVKWRALRRHAMVLAVGGSMARVSDTGVVGALEPPCVHITSSA
jgi:hypothetical protein